jgi:hypothetical protein
MSRVLHVIGEELRKLVPPTLFFLVVFHMLAITQALLAGRTGIGVLRSVAATIGALTVGKAILLVNALPLGRRHDGAPLAVGIAWKTLLFGALTVLFHYLEEVLPKMHAAGGFAAAHRQAMAEVTVGHIVVVQMWLWSAVLLYATGSEVARRYGVARVRQALFGPAPRPGAPATMPPR